MSIWLQESYIPKFSWKLDLFKRKNNGIYNFRCPFCGDSQQNKFKARGYLYQRDGGYVYHCHNCPEHHSFEFFLKFIDANLYQEYKLDLFKENKKSTPPLVDEKKIYIPDVTFGELKSIDQLPSNHMARQYLISRQIPGKFFSKLYYAPVFEDFVNGILPEKFPKEVTRSERIVIPFKDEYGKVTGFQGRDLKKVSKARYITIALNDKNKLMYGLDTVDFNKKFYVLEGPFDSMFIPNSIAVARSDIVSGLIRLPKFNRDNAICVYDNQPRNNQIASKIHKAIQLGMNVCLWPEDIAGKDINDLIKDGGYTYSEILSIIDANSYKGLKAEIMFSKWRKC